MHHFYTMWWIFIENLRLGVFSFLLHDLQDHAAGGGAALRVGVDADWLLGSTCILLAVYINPAATEKGSESLSLRQTVQPMLASLVLVILVTQCIPGGLSKSNNNLNIAAKEGTHLLPVCLVMLRMVAPSLPMIAPTYCVGTSSLRGMSACGGLLGIPELGEPPRGPPRGP